MMDFTAKRLAMSIVALSALKPEERDAETTTAASILAELRAGASVGGRRAYAGAIRQLADHLGPATPAEPWAAFTARGPGKPPPAIELLRPAETTPETGWWVVFKRWTSPGQMYTMLVEGEMPQNELTDLMRGTTLEVVETAVEGVKAASRTAMWIGGALLVGVLLIPVFSKRK